MRNSPIDRPVPGSESRAEQSLLGCLVLGGRLTLAMIEGHVSADDFFDTGYRDVFTALVTMIEAGIPTDDSSVMRAQFAALGVPDSCRTVAFMTGLLKDQPHAGHAVYHAAEVRTAAQNRRLIKLGGKVVDLAYDEQVSPEEILQMLEGEVARIACRNPVEVVSIGEAASKVISDLEVSENTPRSSGVMTGLRDADEAIGPMMGGEVVIIAARPGNGKTSLAMQIAEHNAKRERKSLFVSLEMKDVELARRLLSQMAEVDSRNLREGRVDAAGKLNLRAASEELQALPIRVWAPAAATMAQIRGVARHMQATGRLDLIVVDYLGLIRPAADEKRLQRHEQVQLVTGSLKELAKELNVPALVLCQLNREADNAEPRLSHLRESGSIEQDADMVLMLHHPEGRAEPSKGTNSRDVAKSVAQLIIAKHRHGETCKVKLLWCPSETRFSTFYEGF